MRVYGPLIGIYLWALRMRIYSCAYIIYDYVHGCMAAAAVRLHICVGMGIDHLGPEAEDSIN